MTTTDLEKLKNSLPTGYIASLSERTGFSRSYVCQVINGERNNTDIIDEAIILAKEEKLKREKRRAEIEKL